MPNLKRYREKRDPDSTPEPFFSEERREALSPGAWRTFVVQQHAATRMHWDLRLEIDGVLVSWAVPKGPSLDPSEKRLAVQTEDHPLEYADFEGVIPEGNYGAGAMIVWDRGVYRSIEERGPAEALEAGKLDLELRGHKLQGRFALVRTRRDSGKDWLLLRKGSPPSETGELVEREPYSVYSGLDIEECREELHFGEALEAEIRGDDAPRRRLGDADLRPMLARPGDAPFSRDGWLFEIKHDGARVIASLDERVASLRSRTGRDTTRTYPEIARALRHWRVDQCVLDGEVVALDAEGRSSFERLQGRWGLQDDRAIARAERESPLVFFVFDVLALQGRDLRRLPLARRKELLSQIAPRTGPLRFADHVEGDGLSLFDAVKASGLEGVMAKRAASPYASGERSSDWLKLKVPRRAHVAIVGLVAGRGSRKSLGSLAVAWRHGDSLSYAGQVGSGLDDASIDTLLSRAAELEVSEPCFEGPVPDATRTRRWLRPELVCEVGFTEVTRSGQLRHPVFHGLRAGAAVDACPAHAGPPDTAPEGLAEPPRAAAPRLELTRLDKVFWPVEGYTKRDLLAYYEGVWPWLAPYLVDRPVVLTRYPDGIEGKFFYQKNAPEFTPDWVERQQIDDTDYFLCNHLETLLHVVNSGAIPLHVWSARLASLENPDWVILDLDPKQAPFSAVVTIARHIHALLDSLEAPHFVKTSGQDGLHVMIPLDGTLGHREARNLGEVLARTVAAELPELATIARPLAARADKVYLDFLQNGRGRLIAAPFSVRPRAAAPISMPLSWGQVTQRLDPARWTIRSALAKLRKSGDPFSGVLTESADVPALLEGLSAHLREPGEAR